MCIERQKKDYSKYNNSKAAIGGLLFPLLQNWPTQVTGQTALRSLAEASAISRILLQNNGSCQTKRNTPIPGLD